jgi:molecular chaperone DnaK
VLAQKVADEFWQKTRLDVRHRAVEWQRLLFACERAKRALSFEERAEVVVEGVIQAPQRVDIRQTISRAKLEEVGKELTARATEMVIKALKTAAIHPRHVTEIAMTGGMSRAPFIRRELSRLFDREIAERVNPEEAVCIGAAIHAATLVR